MAPTRSAHSIRPARSARARRAPARPTGPARGPRRPAGAGPLATLAGRVRWDRVGRVALLGVLGLVLLLYIGPAHAWVSTWREAHVRAAQVRALQAEHDRLEAQHRSLRDPRTLEKQARALGMVKPGERSYVISGLPRR
jgi:cell division protein FtsB